MALPVALEEAKRQLKVEDDETDQHDEIEDFIRDAAAWVEDYTGHILEARDVTEHFSGFRPVSLRAWPIAPNAVPAVKYVGPDGQDVTVDSVRLQVDTRPARIGPSVGSFWPFIDSRQLFSVTVRAGYEHPDDVPRRLRRAMLVLIAAYDADREGGKIFAEAEATAKRLCSRFRRRTL